MICRFGIWARWLAWMLAVCISLTAMPAPVFAEEMVAEGELTEEEAENAEGENTEDPTSTGRVYEEKTLEDFDAEFPAIYIWTGFPMWPYYSIFSEKDIKIPKLAGYQAEERPGGGALRRAGVGHRAV